jgi:hypothetical protein
MTSAATLERLLAEQRAALRTGELEALVRLLPRLERAVQDLRPGLGPQGLARLRRTAAENAALLAAALAGVERARALIDRAAAASLATYDASGRIAEGPAEGRTLARR